MRFLQEKKGSTKKIEPSISILAEHRNKRDLKVQFYQ